MLVLSGLGAGFGEGLWGGEGGGEGVGSTGCKGAGSSATTHTQM